MPVAYGHAPPSTLADVLGQVIDAFGAVGDATPIMIGKHYLESFGTGSPPRVLFVPEPDGEMGPPTEMGYAASDTHSCDVYVRGAESGTDLGRFVAAYALKGRVVTAVRRAASGRLEFRKRSGDASPANVDAYGAELAFSFVYTRDIPHDAAIRALPAADADTTDDRPLPPPGQPADGFTITPTTSPTEE